MDFAVLGGLEPLVVLGIDPGTYVLGFGIVGRSAGRLVEVDHGVFRPPSGALIGARLRHLKEGVERLLAHHRPHVVALEEAFVQRNVQSALRIGEARAVVLLAAAEHDLPLVQYPTATVKKSVCGHGGAGKTQVQDLVARHLGLTEPPAPHDAADALALALCLLFDPRLDPRFAAIEPAAGGSSAGRGLRGSRPRR